MHILLVLRLLLGRREGLLIQLLMLLLGPDKLLLLGDMILLEGLLLWR